MAAQKSKTTRISKRNSQSRKRKSWKRPDKVEKPNNPLHDDELLDLIRPSTPVPEVVHGCYAPLTRCTIRVMVFHEGDGNDIRFDFKIISLALLNGQYQALSYAWGEQFDDGSHLTHKIYCGDYAIPVTAHLHAGLRRIRELQRRRKEQNLWVDAICINQADLEERGQQVSMMGRIFANAYQTIVWLGEEDYDSEFSSIEELCSRNPSVAMFDSSAADPFYNERHCVEKLFQRDWFNRRWAVQEYILSREVCFKVGCRLLRATSLADVARGVQSGATPLVLSQTFDRKWLLRPKPLVETMVAFNFSKCTVPHDCVYALLGASSDGDKVNVDYTKPVVDLFVDVTRDFILSKQVENSDDNTVPQVDQVVSRMKFFTQMGRILDLARISRRENGDWSSFVPSWIPLWGSRWLSIEKPRPTAYLSIPTSFEDGFANAVQQHYQKRTSALEIRVMLSYNLAHNVVEFHDRFLVLRGILVNPYALCEDRVRMAPQEHCDYSDSTPPFRHFESADTSGPLNFEDIFTSELDGNESRPDLHLNGVLKSQLDNVNLPRMVENDRVFFMPGLTFVLIIRPTPYADALNTSEASLSRDSAAIGRPDCYTLVDFQRPEFAQFRWPTADTPLIDPDGNRADAAEIIRSACTSICII